MTDTSDVDNVALARDKITKIAARYEPLDVPCSSCLVEAGEPCRTKRRLWEVPEGRHRDHHVAKTGTPYMWVGGDETTPHKPRRDLIPPIDFDGDPVELRNRLASLVERPNVHEGIIVFMMMTVLDLR